MAESRVHVTVRPIVVGRIRIHKSEAGKWRVERCEDIGGCLAWQIYAIRDNWQQAWVFAGWLSGKRQS